jgi:hypothetical protein
VTFPVPADAMPAEIERDRLDTRTDYTRFRFKHAGRAWWGRESTGRLGVWHATSTWSLLAKERWYFRSIVRVCMNPDILRRDLVTEKVADELLIYDPQDSSCHCLNPQAASVWQWLVEGLDVSQMVSAFAEQFPGQAAKAQDIVEASLLEFAKRELLVSGNGFATARPSRRKVLKAIGLGLIATIVAPLPAAAASYPLSISSATYFANSSTWSGIGTGGLSCNFAGSNPGALNSSVNCAPSLKAWVSSYGQIAGFVPSNGLCGIDPLYGVVKMLRVVYACNFVTHTVFLCETGTLAIHC